MRKIKLRKAEAMAGSLFLLLLLIGENLWAQSYRMTSDVICATGGGAQSADFALKASAGGQGSPVGSQSSNSYFGGGGWVYTTESEFTRGDANGDDVIDLGDVVYLLNYLFKSGPPPVPEEAGDANSDGTIDLGDVVYLLNYLFKEGPAPCSGTEGIVILAEIARLKTNRGHAQVWFSLDADQSEQSLPSFAKTSPAGFDEYCQISVMGKFDRDVAGVQLEIEFNPERIRMLDPALTSLTKDFQLFSGTVDGVQKIGVVDLSVGNLIPAGEGALVRLRARGTDLASIRIKEAMLFDKEAMKLAVQISNQLDVEVAKETESRPQAFSLSQNYPNPFNPQTSMRYALPQDAHVRLTVYNVLGQKVAKLVDEHQQPGYKTVSWDGKDEKGNPLASGVYFYRLEAGKFTEVKKMLLVK